MQRLPSLRRRRILATRKEHRVAMTADTRQLVERIQTGDRDAVEQLLCAELPALRAYVRLRAGPALRARESESDLVQSVCREVLGKLDAFQYGGAAGFRDWLFATALRKIVNRAEHHGALKRDARREQAIAATPGNGSTDSELAAVYRSFGSPSQHAIAHELLETMETAFDRLSEDRREIIVLARIVGLDHAQIAERLACSEATARQRLFRALAELAENLAPRQPPRER
jgi:RNA polymerase sigma-70 factor (subfamily 1)